MHRDCVERAGSPLGSAPSAPRGRVRLPENMGRETRGAVQSEAVTLFACLLVSYVAWWPFGWLGQLVRSWISVGTCSSVQKATFDIYLCSVKVAFASLIVPATLIVVLWALRRRVPARTALLGVRLPIAVQRLLAPVVATLTFALFWAWVHYDAPFSTGLLPQIAFPAAVGVLTALREHYGKKTRYSGDIPRLSAWNGKSGKWLRIGVVVAVPLALSAMASTQTVVRHAVLKEQMVVLTGLALGGLLLFPMREPARATSRSSELRRKHE